MMITAIYAALLGFLLIILSARVINMRRSSQISTGSADNEQLTRMVRAHANFTEYVPICLILIASIDFNGFVPDWGVHILGVLLLLGRAMHAYGLSDSMVSYRVRGMVLTLTILFLASAINLIGVILN